MVYLRYLQIFDRGLQHNSQDYRKTSHKVSVVVAVRNEEKNLPSLLTSLVNQTYPRDLYEIIIANDSSQDTSADIIREFQQKWPQIILVDVVNRHQVRSPKKNALAQAIAISSGDVILTTDADCLVSQYWVEAMSALFYEETAMVAGFSRTRLADWQQAPLVQKFEHFDFLSIFLAAAGAVASRKYFSCSGQNLAYTRQAFQLVGGFSRIGHLVSGDDVNLMQLFRRAGLRIVYNFSRHSFVTTRPTGSWQQLLNQRIRWASNLKHQIYLNPEFFLYLVACFLFILLPFYLLFCCWWLGLLLIGIRVLADLKFLARGREIFLIEKNKLKFYPYWFLLQPGYIFLVTLLGLAGAFRWKK